MGYDVPLLVNMQPAGEYLGESFYRAGGVPAVMGELLAEGLLDGAAGSASGVPISEALGAARSVDPAVIRPVQRSDAGEGGLCGPVGEPL